MHACIHTYIHASWSASWGAQKRRVSLCRYWIMSVDLSELRSTQVRAFDDRAYCWSIGSPYRKSLCPVVVCPHLCSSEERSCDDGLGRVGLLVRQSVIIYIYMHILVIVYCMIDVIFVPPKICAGSIGWANNHFNNIHFGHWLTINDFPIPISSVVLCSKRISEMHIIETIVSPPYDSCTLFFLAQSAEPPCQVHRRRIVLQSYTSKDIWRQCKGSFCKEILFFSSVPCRQMPLLVYFGVLTNRRPLFKTHQSEVQ